MRAGRKLAPVYPEIVKRFEVFAQAKDIDAFANRFRKRNGYQNLRPKLAMELLRSVFSLDEICMWYDTYGVTDPSIVAAATKAMNEVFRL